MRPNETRDAKQPRRWVEIRSIGISMGKVFALKELSAAGAKDKVHTLVFTASP